MNQVLIPHTFEARGFEVSVDGDAPNSLTSSFEVDGRQQYSFSLSRRQLIRLFSAIGRALKEAPRVRSGTKASGADAMAPRRRWPSTVRRD